MLIGSYGVCENNLRCAQKGRVGSREGTEASAGAQRSSRMELTEQSRDTARPATAHGYSQGADRTCRLLELCNDLLSRSTALCPVSAGRSTV